MTSLYLKDRSIFLWRWRDTGRNQNEQALPQLHLAHHCPTYLSMMIHSLSNLAQKHWNLTVSLGLHFLWRLLCHIKLILNKCIWFSLLLWPPSQQFERVKRYFFLSYSFWWNHEGLAGHPIHSEAGRWKFGKARRNQWRLGILTKVNSSGSLWRPLERQR